MRINDAFLANLQVRFEARAGKNNSGFVALDFVELKNSTECDFIPVIAKPRVATPMSTTLSTTSIIYQPNTTDREYKKLEYR